MFILNPKAAHSLQYPNIQEKHRMPAHSDQSQLQCAFALNDPTFSDEYSQLISQT